MVLLEKVRLLLDKHHNIVVISCLVTRRGAPPIYEVFLRKKFNSLGEKCKFYSAEEICNEMLVPVDETEFYSVLEQFIKKKQNQGRSHFILDEFGDNVTFRYAVAQENEKLLMKLMDDIESLAKIKDIHITIAVHPCWQIDVEQLKHQGYTCFELETVMRNTASIYGYEQAVLSRSNKLFNSTTVIGLSPVYIANTGEDFYTNVVNEVCKSKKFVCIFPDKTNKFDESKFSVELKSKWQKPIFFYKKEQD